MINASEREIEAAKEEIGSLKGQLSRHQSEIDKKVSELVDFVEKTMDEATRLIEATGRELEYADKVTEANKSALETLLNIRWQVQRRMDELYRELKEAQAQFNEACDIKLPSKDSPGYEAAKKAKEKAKDEASDLVNQINKKLDELRQIEVEIASQERDISSKNTHIGLIRYNLQSQNARLKKIKEEMYSHRSAAESARKNMEYAYSQANSGMDRQADRCTAAKTALRSVRQAFCAGGISYGEGDKLVISSSADVLSRATAISQEVSRTAELCRTLRLRAREASRDLKDDNMARASEKTDKTIAVLDACSQSFSEIADTLREACRLLRKYESC